MPRLDRAWGCRLMMIIVLSLLLVGDLYGYRGSVRGVKTDHQHDEVAVHRGGAAPVPRPPTGPAAAAAAASQKNAQIEFAEEHDFDDFSTAAALKSAVANSDAKLKKNLATSKAQLTDAIKESCLPKMLCELASKPEYMLSEKEKELLRLIRSPTMPWMMNMPPSKWYFAAHMGELMRYTGDSLSGPMGCANLWPNCPISSKKLMKLSYKVRV